MLSIIEKCQNTENITVCCMGLHSNRPVKSSHDYPCSPLKATMGMLNIRTGPWSNGIRLPGLMNHIWLSGEWPGAHALFTWGRDGSRMHYGKKARQLENFNLCHSCGCNLTCHALKSVQERFKDVLPWPPNYPVSMGCAGPTNQSMETPPHSLQGLKDLLLISLCQIPHMFRNPVESMPSCIKAVLAA